MRIMLIDQPGQAVSAPTGAGNGGSDGLFLHVKGCPAHFRFDSALEAYEIAEAILAGLHREIEAERSRLMPFAEDAGS